MSTLDVVDKQKTESSPSRTNICSETFLGEGNIPIDLFITPEVPKQLLSLIKDLVSEIALQKDELFLRKGFLRSEISCRYRWD